MWCTYEDSILLRLNWTAEIRSTLIIGEAHDCFGVVSKGRRVKWENRAREMIILNEVHKKKCFTNRLSSWQYWHERDKGRPRKRWEWPILKQVTMASSWQEVRSQDDQATVILAGRPSYIFRGLHLQQRARDRERKFEWIYMRLGEISSSSKQRSSLGFRKISNSIPFVIERERERQR